MASEARRLRSQPPGCPRQREAGPGTGSAGRAQGLPKTRGVRLVGLEVDAAARARRGRSASRSRPASGLRRVVQSAASSRPGSSRRFPRRPAGCRARARADRARRDEDRADSASMPGQREAFLGRGARLLDQAEVRLDERSVAALPSVGTGPSARRVRGLLPRGRAPVASCRRATRSRSATRGSESASPRRLVPPPSPPAPRTSHELARISPRRVIRRASEMRWARLILERQARGAPPSPRPARAGRE